ncbi:NUDIX hydrolase [Miniphocaeibacter halophilus]|uniref:NUDIX domain-containing protein n=1 Tax=Miniphocaeibacter halophilus TaxID=2931922 RepID=A0AC61MX96_9FIRM|nr:NUDIX domain-containing protein [Miniphocaeibacter halophilus]QQK08879.1 NUDIX domain-containing protein [Miniphocaeibacter halophilus]
METWDIYDKNRNIIGETGTDCKIGCDQYHLAVHVCIFNFKGEMLIQKRQAFMKIRAGLWDLTAGGNAIAGEKSYQAAERETFEELGIKLDLKNTRPHLTLNFPTGFDDIFLLEREIDISALKLQEEEVEKVKWASRDEIIKLIKEDKFLSYYPSFIEMLFDIRKSYRTYFK